MNQAKSSFMFKGIRLGLAVFFVIAAAMQVAPRGAFAASCDGEDLKALKDDMALIRKDMGEIKRVLISVLPALVNARAGAQGGAQGVPSGRKVQQQVPTTAVVSLSGGESLGNRKARVAIVEFSDFQCPFCGRFHDDAFKEIRKNFVDTGKVLFVYKDFPLSFHEHAMDAALAARCAGEQGKYWKMHDLLFRNQRDLSNIEVLAKKAGLDMGSYEKCVKSGKQKAAVKANMDEARKVGVRGTPYFVIGEVKDGKLNGVVVPGAAPYAVFRDKLNSVLKEK